MAQRKEKVTITLDAVEFIEGMERATRAARDLRKELDLLAEFIGPERPSRLSTVSEAINQTASRRVCNPNTEREG